MTRSLVRLEDFYFLCESKCLCGCCSESPRQVDEICIPEGYFILHRLLSVFFVCDLSSTSSKREAINLMFS